MLKWIIAILFSLVLCQSVLAADNEAPRFTPEQERLMNLYFASIEELRTEAEQGDVNAQLILGGRYTKGVGPDGEPDYLEAAKWYTMAAE